MLLPLCERASLRLTPRRSFHAEATQKKPCDKVISVPHLPFLHFPSLYDLPHVIHQKIDYSVPHSSLVLNLSVHPSDCEVSKY